MTYIPLPAPPISPFMVAALPPPEPFLPPVTAPIELSRYDPSALIGASVDPPSLPTYSSLGPAPSPSLAIAGLEAYRANVESPERADFFVVPPMFRDVFRPGSAFVPLLLAAGMVYLAVKS